MITRFNAVGQLCATLILALLALILVTSQAHAAAEPPICVSTVRSDGGL